LIHENDEKAALGFARAVKDAFAVDLALDAKAEASNVRGNAKQFSAARVTDNDKETYWATDDTVTQASLTVDFGKPTVFNRFLVQEYIRLGQRVKAFRIDALVGGDWRELAHATTIGYKRILRFPTVEATQIRFNITDSKSSPVISSIGVFNAPQIMDPPSVIRNQAGEIIITPADVESEVYFSMDGSTPTLESEKYTGPVPTRGKLEVQAFSFDPYRGKNSPVSREAFDLPRKDWKILGTDDEEASAIIDGNPSSGWYQPEDKKMPVDMVIDLGTELNLSGFRYYPDQRLWNPGIITQYQFFVSGDNRNWKLVDQGEFSNIRNNPLWQTKKFDPIQSRYIKLRALANTVGNSRTGYAEIEVITE
jgi:alpha-L-fucosidase